MIPGWHPLVVQFPVALTAMSAVSFSVARLLPQERTAALLSFAGTLNLCLGAFAVLFALGSGLAAVIGLNLGPAAQQAVSSHVKAAAVTAVLMLLAAVWRGVGSDPSRRPSLPFIAFLWLTTVALGITAYRGAENVFGHGIGVAANDLTA